MAFCKKCGASLEPGLGACRSCGAETGGQAQPGKGALTQGVGDDFWKNRPPVTFKERVTALAIDAAFLYVLHQAFVLIFGIRAFNSMNPAYRSTWLTWLVPMSTVLWMPGLLLSLYHFSEVAFGWTPGKRLMRLMVRSSDGSRAMPGQLMRRWVMKAGLLSLATLIEPFLVLLQQSHKPALALGKLSGASVLVYLPMLLLTVLSIWRLFTGGQKAQWDSLAGTVVMRGPSEEEIKARPELAPRLDFKGFFIALGSEMKGVLKGICTDADGKFSLGALFGFIFRAIKRRIVVFIIVALSTSLFHYLAIVLSEGPPSVYNGASRLPWLLPIYEYKDRSGNVVTHGSVLGYTWSTLLYTSVSFVIAYAIARNKRGASVMNFARAGAGSLVGWVVGFFAFKLGADLFANDMGLAEAGGNPLGNSTSNPANLAGNGAGPGIGAGLGGATGTEAGSGGKPPQPPQSSPRPAGSSPAPSPMPSAKPGDPLGSLDNPTPWVTGLVRPPPGDLPPLEPPSDSPAGGDGPSASPAAEGPSGSPAVTPSRTFDSPSASADASPAPSSESPAVSSSADASLSSAGDSSSLSPSSSSLADSSSSSIGSSSSSADSSSSPSPSSSGSSGSSSAGSDSSSSGSSPSDSSSSSGDSSSSSLASSSSGGSSSPSSSESASSESSSWSSWSSEWSSDTAAASSDSSESPTARLQAILVPATVEIQAAWVGTRPDVGSFGKPEFSEILIRNWTPNGPPVEVIIDTIDGFGHLAVEPTVDIGGSGTWKIETFNIIADLSNIYHYSIRWSGDRNAPAGTTFAVPIIVRQGAQEIRLTQMVRVTQASRTGARPDAGVPSTPPRPGTGANSQGTNGDGLTASLDPSGLIVKAGNLTVGESIGVLVDGWQVGGEPVIVTFLDEHNGSLPGGLEVFPRGGDSEETWQLSGHPARFGFNIGARRDAPAGTTFLSIQVKQGLFSMNPIILVLPVTVERNPSAEAPPVNSGTPVPVSSLNPASSISAGGTLRAVILPETVELAQAWVGATPAIGGYSPPGFSQVLIEGWEPGGANIEVDIATDMGGRVVVNPNLLLNGAPSSTPTSLVLSTDGVHRVTLTWTAKPGVIPNTVTAVPVTVRQGGNVINLVQNVRFTQPARTGQSGPDATPPSTTTAAPGSSAVPTGSNQAGLRATLDPNFLVVEAGDETVGQPFDIVVEGWNSQSAFPIEVVFNDEYNHSLPGGLDVQPGYSSVLPWAILSTDGTHRFSQSLKGRRDAPAGFQFVNITVRQGIGTEPVTLRLPVTVVRNRSAKPPPT